MKIYRMYVVHRTAGGFAREDGATSEVVGIYTDVTVAKKVALLARGTWSEVDIDYVWPGLEDAAREFGITL